MADQIRLGIVGAGSIVRKRHLPNLRRIAGVRVVAVANRHVERAREVAQQFDIPTVHEGWEEVVAAADVDAVLIGTPPYLHEEATLRALEDGKHVFCQARMADGLAAAQRMLMADRQTELTTMLCPPPHYLNVDPHVGRLLADGQLGEVRHVVVNHAGAMFADPAQPLHWRQRADVNGINLLDVGIVAEVVQDWFGPVAEVYATAPTWISERPPDADGHTAVQTPDAASITGTFASGATLTALFSGAIRGGRPSLVVHGTRGTLTCWPHQVGVELCDADGATATYDVPADEQGQWTVEADFIETVRAGDKGSPSFEDGVRYMAVTHAVLESSTTGRPVVVEQPGSTVS